LPDKDYSGGIEGFNYDWFWVARKAPDKRKSPVVHLVVFSVVVAALCASTYADLGSNGYAAKAARLLDSEGLERIAGQVMVLKTVAEHATRTKTL
jgi:hypothetical protein